MCEEVRGDVMGRAATMYALMFCSKELKICYCIPDCNPFLEVLDCNSKQINKPKYAGLGSCKYFISATVFGDPHIVTFDELEYTFNGKGEYVLVHVNSSKAKFDVQGRFEQLASNFYGVVNATQLTSVAGKKYLPNQTINYILILDIIIM